MCIPCMLIMHDECINPVSLDNGVESNCCCYSEHSTESSERTIEPVEKEFADVISTGRKRAAQLKPIIEDMVCEWAMLKEAGGGAVPIVGCAGTLLTKEKGNKERTGNIHHGPNKSTLCNTDENLHRICSKCHNRWHVLNDPYYPADRPEQGADFLPIGVECLSHNKYDRATSEEFEYSEAWWGLPTKAKEMMPFRKKDSDE